ncbi:MAG: methyltransferase domain-containing protein [Alphaproteobacteria bacterium]
MPDSDNIFLIMEMRRMGISDIRIMEASEKIPANIFPEEGFINTLGVNNNKDISRALAVAILAEALELNNRHKVLEIGTGSGYQTAILSRLCRRIYSISSSKDAVINADKIISNLGISNFTLMKSDPEKGLENQAPFDRIIINQVFFEIPEIIKKQLAENGILIAPTGFAEGENQVLKSYSLIEGKWQEKELMPIKFIYP